MSFGVQPTKSRATDGTFISFEFEVSPVDLSDNPRVDIEGDPNNEIAIFSDAVENFQGSFSKSSPNVPEDIPQISTDFNISIGQGEESSVIPDPTTLDLVARKGETEYLGTVYPSIKYSFVGPELTASGIDEYSIILLDGDGIESNGFQVYLTDDGDQIIKPPIREFPVGPGGIRRPRLVPAEFPPDVTPVTIDPIKAVNDINYITGEDESSSISPLVLADIYSLSVSTPSGSESEIDGFNGLGENFLIEAEDLILDDNYQVRSEPIGSGEDSFEVIELRDRDITGTASFTVGSDLADISFDEYSSASLTISTFDESDGVGEIQVLKNDVPIMILDDGIFQDFVTLNETPPSGPNFPNEDIRQEFIFQLGSIETGDEIKIIGTSNEEEFVRLDFITLEV